jgi:MOSC domain-containing protein YiiM
MNASELDLRARVVLSTQPRLLQILIAASPSAAMESLEEVMAIPGQGLAGDRYFTGLGTFSPNPQKPDFELTLIESEQVRDYVNRTGLNFTATDARRNLVTEGIDLNGLVGKEFTIGSVRIRGIRLCEPCNYLAKITHPEVLHGLVHRGGLRAAILSEGVIRCGDLIRV